MPCYTCITENRGHVHLSQHEAASPGQAFRKHIGELPFVEGINPLGDELYWLQTIASHGRAIELQPMAQCKQTWQWLGGAHHTPPYTSYIIKSDVGE